MKPTPRSNAQECPLPESSSPTPASLEAHTKALSCLLIAWGKRMVASSLTTQAAKSGAVPCGHSLGKR